MFKELEIVASKNELPNIPIGAKGTVVYIYDDKKHFEVEFVDDNNDTIALMTVSESDIIRYSQNL